MPDFSYSPIYWTTLIVHEFAHSFVNPISARNSERVAEINTDSYRETLHELMYGDSMETYINETIIRAIECLYVRKYFAEQHDGYVKDYVDEGFGKISEVEELLAGMSGSSLKTEFKKLLSVF